MNCKHSNVTLTRLDKIEIIGSTLIDSIVSSAGEIEYIKEYTLLHSNQFAYLDYSAWIVNTNLDDHFREQLSSHDGMNKVILNPSKRS